MFAIDIPAIFISKSASLSNLQQINQNIKPQIHRKGEASSVKKLKPKDVHKKARYLKTKLLTGAFEKESDIVTPIVGIESHGELFPAHLTCYQGLFPWRYCGRIGIARHH